MRNKTIYLLYAAAICMVTGCMTEEKSSPFEGDLNTLTVNAVYPSGFTSYARSGVSVSISDINLGNHYTVTTGDGGVASVTLPDGIYSITISDRDDENIFNGNTDRVTLSSDLSVNVSLTQSKAGTIVIKEIYNGGCSKAPAEGDYGYDKYMILHNNDTQIRYLDSLCFGTLSPYNSNSTNPWISRDPTTGETIYKNFVPIIQSVWQFGGTGKTFPLAPGEDAVVCFNGAIDHTVQYPLSVNLNRKGYFVCYNTTYFPNTSYHPAPGDQIQQDHILNVVIKTGISNAYAVSVSSPAMVLFKAQGTTIQDFVQKADNVINVPGGTVDKVTCIPLDWVVDAVEVFTGKSSSNTKRLQSALDAGYVTLSDTYLGHTEFRRTDESATAAAGFEILQDTNNSTNDFYERTTQSLH